MRCSSSDARLGRSLLRFGPQIDLAKRAALLVQAAIETGPAFSVNLARQSIEDITFAARSQLDGHAFLGAGAHPLADIGAVDHKVLAACRDAANQHMDMRIVGVPVIDGHPVKAGVEIAGHVGHQFTREGAQVAHIVRILRRDDEAEVVPVVLAALGKAVPIGLVGRGIEHPAMRSVARRSLALNIVDMTRERRGPGLGLPLANNAGLDQDTPPKCASAARQRSELTASIMSRAATACAACLGPCVSSLVRDLSYPAEQRLGLSVGASAAVARTPGLDIEIIVSHAAQQEAMAPSPLKKHRKSAVATAL